MLKRNMLSKKEKKAGKAESRLSHGGRVSHAYQGLQEASAHRAPCSFQTCKHDNNDQEDSLEDRQPWMSELHPLMRPCSDLTAGIGRSIVRHLPDGDGSGSGGRGSGLPPSAAAAGACSPGSVLGGSASTGRSCSTSFSCQIDI